MCQRCCIKVTVLRKICERDALKTACETSHINFIWRDYNLRADTLDAAHFRGQSAGLEHAHCQHTSSFASASCAGDHHIHSRFSVGWDMTKVPPAPILGGDAIFPIPMNALMARHFGLGWMVATDHGGPNHSHVSLERTYPELQLSRELVPEVMQFFGMEFDTPGADHSSLIVPNTHDEAEHLVSIESQFSKREPWPVDLSWDTEPRMLEALQAMQRLPEPPILIAHHPSRSAMGARAYGLVHPAELRAWNNSAPGIAVGMEGSPGHQAGGLNPDGSANPKGARGAYGAYPTLGGFDQMTAVVGGFWDSMLGEGRDWWITANSDSHQHVSEGGSKLRCDSGWYSWGAHLRDDGRSY